MRTVEFETGTAAWQRKWEAAVRVIDQSIRSTADGDVLLEGADYPGAWLESTASVSTEFIGRFVDGVVRSTHLAFARRSTREGLLPYKVVDEVGYHRQIQMVSPLARAVWNEYRRGGGSTESDGYARTMYDAMCANDAWLAEHRDSMGLGGVEAFCAFDTGHDASPRFWFAPDFTTDAETLPEHPLLPYLAPDLTANVMCQRRYLAKLATALGAPDAVRDAWLRKAEESEAALFRYCWDDVDGIFYDRARPGGFVRVQSDVLLRVLSCEAGDEAFFVRALKRYLLNTRKFLSPAGFTSLALDDPRFDRDYTKNSWGGPVNLLALLRAIEPFERHGHVAELLLVSLSVMDTLVAAEGFPQCLDPWSGSAGFGDSYSPCALWVADFVERFYGVLETPDGETWCTCAPPLLARAGRSGERVRYHRVGARGVAFAVVADETTAQVLVDGRVVVRYPRGLRVVFSADGAVTAVVCVAPAPVQGVVEVRGKRMHIDLAPNQRLTFDPESEPSVTGVEFVAPVF